MQLVQSTIDGPADGAHHGAMLTRWFSYTNMDNGALVHIDHAEAGCSRKSEGCSTVSRGRQSGLRIRDLKPEA